MERVKSGLQNFMLEISLDDAPWLGRPVEVDSNQINKVLVKMKNVSFILQKKVNGHFGQPNRW